MFHVKFKQLTIIFWWGIVYLFWGAWSRQCHLGTRGFGRLPYLHLQVPKRNGWNRIYNWDSCWNNEIQSALCMMTASLSCCRKVSPASVSLKVEATVSLNRWQLRRNFWGIFAPNIFGKNTKISWEKQLKLRDHGWFSFLKAKFGLGPLENFNQPLSVHA